MRFAVIDSGHYLDFALMLLEYGAEKVYYSVDWFRAFPRIEDYATGFGYEEKYPGFIKVLDAGMALRKADYVVFTDVGLGGLAKFLEEKGVKVWGAKIPAQMLESDRFYMDYITRKSIGRPKEVRMAMGFEHLKQVVADMLSRHEKVVVKMSVFRGNMETQLVSDVKDLDVIFSQTNLEPINKWISFIVEEAVDGVEWGFDGYFDGEDFVRPYAHSPEMKGEGVCMVAMHDRSFLDDLILDKLRDYLVKAGFKGFISLEFFLDGEKIYLTDYTIRLPYPGAGLLARIYGNLPELIASALDGKPVKPSVKWKYAVEMRVYPEDNAKWLPFHLPARLFFNSGKRWSVYLGNSNGSDGVEYDDYLFVPGGTDLGSAIGLSNDGIMQAYEQAVEVAKLYDSPDKKYSGNAWEIFEEKRRKVEEWYGRIY
ncbi:MAG: hypothetical protein QXW39_08130 [Candidatus Bathyarchaeia archaeon]|uniref:hypothetical protein n=1 Tax=Thermofilum sp. TaxID=1961369 RepID=UPI00315EC0DF